MMIERIHCQQRRELDGLDGEDGDAENLLADENEPGIERRLIGNVYVL